MPTLTNDTFAVSEDGFGFFDLFANDLPDLGLPLSVVSIDLSGTLGLVGASATGSGYYNPFMAYEYLAAGETAVDSFSYTASDGSGWMGTASVAVTITGVNDGPDARDDTLVFTENGIQTGSLFADNGNGIDFDIDASDVVTITAINGVTFAAGTPFSVAGLGQLSIQSDGSFTFDPGTDFDYLAVGESETETLTYTIDDGNGGTDTATVTLTVEGVNDAPDALDDDFTTGSPDILVNETVTGDQTNPRLVQLSDSSVLVVWASEGASAGQYTVFGQRYALDGTKLGGEITLASATTPEIAVEALAGGGFGLGWVQSGVLHGSMFDNSGTATSSIFTPGAVASGEASPEILQITNGDLLYTWNETDNGGDIVGRFYNTAGSPVTSDFDPPEVLTGLQADAATANFRLVSDAFITAWETPDSDGSGIAVRVIGPTSAGSESIANGSETGNQVDPDVAALADGRYLVTWTSEDAGGDTVRAAFFPASGNAYASNMVIAPNGASGARVSAISGDRFVVTYVLETTGEIRGTILDASLGGGTILFTSSISGSFLVADSAAGLRTAPDVRELSNGNLAFVWQTNEDDGDTSGVPGIDPSGFGIRLAILGPDGLELPGIGTDEDTPFTIAAADLLANDTDVDASDTLTITAIDTAGLTGTLTDNGNGTFTYDPNGQLEHLAVGESATVSFSYTVSDGNGGTDTATVTLAVDGVNDDPVAVDDITTSDEDTALTISGAALLTNDSDVDASDVLSVLSVDDTGLLGTLTDNGNGTFTYDPNGQFEYLATGESATDTFSYTVSDGNGGTDTATVTLTIDGVNDGPLAGDDSATTDEDTVLTISGAALLANDSDVDASDVLSIQSVDDSALTGTLTDNGDGTYSYDPNGQFEYLAVGEQATDSFDYTVSDGSGGTDTATVTITVTGVNDAPVAADDGLGTDEDTAITGSVLADNGNGADSDPDLSDTLTVSEVNGSAGDVGNQITLASGALLTLNANGTYSYDPNGQFEYLSTGESATDSFTYTVSDGNGGTDTAIVTLTIDGVNDGPLAGDDSATTDEDTVLTIEPADILGNDTDAEDDTLTIIDAFAASGAQVTINGDGSLTYTPVADFNGLDTITYEVADGNGGTGIATISVTVNPIADAPRPENDTPQTDENTPITFNVLANDSDPDNAQPLTIVGVSSPGLEGLLTNNGGGSFTYDPNGAFDFLGNLEAATEVFTYTVRDSSGLTSTATATITVDGVNADPVAGDDALTGATDEDTPLIIAATTLLANDTDADGDTITITGIDTTGTQGSVTDNGDGTFTYDPTVAYASLTAGQTATDTFSYTVDDGEGGSDTATVTVTINGRDDILSVVGEILTVSENGPATVLDVLSNDLGDGLSVVSVNTTGTQGTVVNNMDGTVTYDPNGAFAALIGGQTDTDTFTYTVEDSAGQTQSATVTVTIEGANEAPTALNDTASVVENQAVTGMLLANDSDPEAAGPLSVTQVNGSGSFVGRFATLPSGAELRVNTDGSFTYESGAAFDDLAAGQSTTDSFTYTVADTDGATSTATATITITGTDDPLTPYTLTARTNEDQLTTIAIDLAALDPDSAVTITGFDATGLAGVVNQTGPDSFTFDPRGAYDALNPGDIATGTFTIDLSNGSETGQMTVDLTIDGLAEPVAEVSFEQVYTTVDEGDSGSQTITLALKRTGPLTTTIDVDYALDLTGTAGLADVAGALSGTVTFGLDQDTVLIPVGIAGDLLDETDESFQVVLSNAARADSGPVVITSAASTIKITDNDEPVIYSAGSNVTVSEGNPGENRQVVFTITRNDDSAPGSIDYALQLGVTPSSLASSDFEPGTVFSGTAQFTAGQSSTTVSFALAGDVDVEPDEFAQLVISNPSFTGGTAVLGDATASVQVRNDDTRRISIESRPVGERVLQEGDDGTTQMTFTLERSGPLTETIEVGYALTPGAPEITSAITRLDATDGDVVGGLIPDGTVIFAPGQQTATITIDIVADEVFEGNDAFSLELTGATSSNPNVNVQLGNAVESVIILNDDGVPDLPASGVSASVIGAQAFTTFDGVAYRAQLEGDFTLVQTTAGDPDPINIQGRFETFDGAPLAPVLTGLALEIGGRIVEIGTGANAVLIDGQPPSANEQALGAIDLDGDNSVDIIIEDEITFIGTTQEVTAGRQITVVLNDAGEQLRIFRGEDFLSATVHLSDGTGGHAGVVEGLLGNGDGSLANEFGQPGGAALPPGATASSSGLQQLTYEYFYGQGDFSGAGYLDGWAAGTSLFDTAFVPGALAPIAYGLGDLPASVLLRAQDVVAQYGITDPILEELATISFALTNERDVIEGIVQRGLVPDALATTTANPVIPSVFGVSTATATVNEGDSGIQTVLFEVYRTGDASQAATVTYEVSGAVDAADFAPGTALSGTLSFAAGERLILVPLEIAGDTLSELDERLLLRLTGVSDPAATIGAGSAAINVITDDFVPNVTDDAFGGFEDTTIVENVLANDSDDDGDALTVVQFRSTNSSTPLALGAAHVLNSGDTVTLEADGTLSFTPNENLATGASRVETLFYIVSDGQGGQTQGRIDVTITGVVEIVNARGDAVATDEDSTTSIAVLDNDTGSGLSIVGIDTTGVTGTVTQQGDVILYDPNGQFEALAPGATAVESFSYTIRDDEGAEDTATVQVTITGRSEPPTPVADSATTDEDTAITFDPAANDTDPDGDPLTVTAVSLVGTAGVAVVLPDGTVRYDPDGAFEHLLPGQSATDSFSYTVSDGQGETASETVTVTVTGVNDAAVANADSIQTDEDTSSTPVDLLANDAGDAPALTSIDTTGTIGQVIDLGGGQVRYDPNGQFEALALGQSATDSFAYTITDSDGETATATVTVTIDGRNEPPVAVDDGFTLDEESDTTFGVLGNDSDPEGGALTITNISAGGLAGQLTVLGADSFRYDASGAFDFLGLGQSATDSFTYTVTDPDGQSDTGTVTFTVTGVNDAPDAVDDTRTIGEDVVGTFGLLSNDIDVDGDPLDFLGTPTASSGSVVVNPNGTITFTPEQDFFGTVTIDYAVTDGNGGTDTAQAVITVNAINDAPVAVDDTATVDEDGSVTILVLDDDTDVEGDTLMVSEASAGNGSVTINANGTLGYTPDADFNGTDTIIYTVTDGNGGSDTGTVTVTVTPVNDAPQGVDDTGTTNKNEAVTLDLLANDTDVDGDGLTVQQLSTPGNGSVVLDPEGTVTYTPDAGYVGPDSFTYRPFDGTALGAPITVSLTVFETNADPVAVADTATTSLTDPVTIDILANDTDGDNDTLTVTSAVVDFGTVVLNPDDTVTYTADEGFGGNATITYTIDDGNGGSATGTATVTVTAPGGGTGGNDVLVGTSGNDTLYGLSGRDTLFGEGGNDLLIGGPDDDRLEGGDGDDELRVGTGDDVAIGEGGSDTLVDDLGDDILSGGPGFDTADFSAHGGGVGVDLDGNVALAGGAFQFGSYQNATETNQLIGIENVIGSDFDDLIETRNGAATTTNGGGGNDRIVAGIRNDVVEGGDGNDTIITNAGTDVIFDDAGDDVINGGPGFDLIDFSRRTGDISVDLNTNIAQFGGTLSAGGAYSGATETNQLFGIENAIGSDFNDLIIAKTGSASTIEGGAGDDRLIGGIRNDTLIGGDGDDRMISGDNNDVLVDGQGNDTLSGETGYDLADFSQMTSGVSVDLDGNSAEAGGTLLSGGAYTGATEFNVLFGIEGIIGSSFDDLLNGKQSVGAVIRAGDGNDRLNGGDLRDQLYGDDGDDRVFGFDGGDLIYDGAGNDTMNGGADDDLVDFSAHATGVFVDLDGNSALAGGSVNATGVYSGATETNMVFAFEQIVGTAQADRIEGRGSAETTIAAGAGDDWIFGGSDEDDITGGLGDDVIDLGSGVDTFRFVDGDGADTVIGFGSDDLVVLNTAVHASDQDVVAALATSGSDVILALGGGDTILFQNTSIGDFSTANFDII